MKPFITVNLDEFESSFAKEINIALGGGFGTTGELRLTENQWQDLPEDVRARITARTVAKLSEEKRLEAEAAAGEEAFDARVKYWIRQGMEATRENVRILIAAVNAHPNLKDAAPTPEMIDAAVELCREKLSWRKPQPVPTPAPAPAPEPAVILSDGSQQKSLHETPNNSWSVQQLKDWFKRSDGQKLLRSQQYGGSSRSSWFKADSQVI